MKTITHITIDDKLYKLPKPVEVEINDYSNYPIEYKTAKENEDTLKILIKAFCEEVEEEEAWKKWI